jgi:hypothetical protein
LHVTSLDGFFHGTAAVEPRSRAAAVPAFACVLLVGHTTDTRLQIWQLELFPQPVDDVVDGQFQHELHATGLSGALALVLSAGLVFGSA